MEPYVGKLLASFKRLYLNQLYSDITLTAFGHTFKLHRIVLVSNAYFSSLIDGPWAENGSDMLTLHFDDTNISLEALKLVIARMYGIDDDMNLKQNVLSLLATGCFFDDEPLCIKCVEHIESDMSPTTVIPYLTFAEHNYYGVHSESILHACLTTLCKNASNASYLPSIAKLPRVHLASVLASDCLHVENEAMRFELVENVMQLRRTIYSFSTKSSCSSTPSILMEKEQGGHRRETSASSTDTLIEQSLGAKESFPLDAQESFIHQQDDEEDIQSLHQQILSKSILYSNLPFSQLQKIRRDSKPTISDTILQKALWQQIELRSLVLCADKDALDLGIQYDSQSDDDDLEEAIETENSEYEATSPVGSFNQKPRNMPMQDTETMEGGKGVFDLIRAGSLWNHVACPPFRFGCTFDGMQLEKMEVSSGGVGAKIYSGSNFYAGSMWQVYIQKLDGNEGPALGVYLQRTLPKETEKDATNVSHYIDKRIHARVWFQIICYFGNSQCCILESKPDLFKAEQSWGWRSTKMFKDVCAGVSGGEHAPPALLKPATEKTHAGLSFKAVLLDQLNRDSPVAKAADFDAGRSGVVHRSPMGEYVPPTGEGPLSNLANPTPGPLTYDPKLPPSGFQYSILGKHVQTKGEKDTLGPGPAYQTRNTNVAFQDSPHWSFAKKLGTIGMHNSADLKVDNKNPSPFAYESKVNAFGKQGPRYTVSGWSAQQKEVTPSPDKYNNAGPVPVAGANPKYSFGLKTNLPQDPIPGPQDYTVHPDKTSSISTAPSYTCRPRVGIPVFTNKEDYLIPGCNEYHVKLPGSQKAASLKGWYKEGKSLKTPGPANYIIPETLFNGPQYSLSGRSNDNLQETAQPGPANYHPQPLFEQSPQFSLGRKPKPDPGKFTEKTLRNAEFPGPSVYEPKDRQIRHNGAPKVTLKGRYNPKVSNSPGPADYNTAAPIERTLSAAQLARLERPKDVPPRIRTTIEKTPGPSSYTLTPVTTIKHSGPKYSLAKRLQPVKPDSTPSPNNYYASKRLDGPKITMKSRMSPFVLVFPSQRVDTLRLK
ncbi:hypothetical protein HDU77_005283 [Chytriomyces hyalinus]|nr:hypothetical protein HDU77_005283 [Chytriomyces hyalinus]